MSGTIVTRGNKREVLPTEGWSSALSHDIPFLIHLLDSWSPPKEAKADVGVTLISGVHHRIRTAKSGEGCHCVFLPQELCIKIWDVKTG